MNKKTTQLNAASALQATDLFPIVQNVGTIPVVRRAALSQLNARWSNVVITVGEENADYTTDGVADNEQLQLAANAVHAAGGGTVYVLPYNLDIQAETLVYSDTLIECSQGALLTLNAAFADYTIFRHAATGQSNMGFRNVRGYLSEIIRTGGIWLDTASKVNIYDCRFWNNSTTASTFGSGIDFDNVTNSRLENVDCSATSSHGIALKNSSDIDVLNCIGAYGHDRGLLIDPNCTHIRVKGGKYSNNSFNGVHINHGSKYVSVIGVTANNNGISGIAVQNASIDPMTNFGSLTLIQGNFCMNNAQEGIVAARTFNVSILGNHCEANSQNGIKLTDVKGCTVIGNISRKNVLRNILLEDQVYDSTIVGNICNYGQIEGLHIRARIYRCTITDNICMNNGQTTPNTRSGITVLGDGTGFYPTNNVIANNISGDDQTADTTTLSATANSGQKILTVVSSIPFQNVGNRLITITDGVNTETARINTIDSNTQITLQTNLVHTYLSTSTITGTATQQYGIKVADALCVNNLIYANQLHGNLTADFFSANTALVEWGNMTDGGLRAATFPTLKSDTISEFTTGSGTTIAGILLKSGVISNLTNPSSAQDAATKAYVDGVLSGLSIKQSVQLATAAALPTNTYLSGVITITATGVLTVDGVTVALNDRVLVKDEVAQANNGIYLCTVAGAIGVSAVLTRATDSDSGAEILGSFTFVEKGTVNMNSGFVNINTSVPTIGSTSINYTQFSGAGQITAGDGLSKSANTLSANVDGSTLEISSDNLRVKDGGITDAKIATGIDAVKLADGSISNTEFQYLNGLTDAIQTQLDARRKVLSTIATSSNVASSSAETDILSFTLPANTLSTNHIINMKLHCNYFNNTGIAQTFTLRLKYGSTTIASFTSISINSSSAHRIMILDAYIRGNGATNAQKGNLFQQSTSFSTATDPGTAAEDSTTPLTLKITVQHSNSDVNLVWTTDEAVVALAN